MAELRCAHALVSILLSCMSVLRCTLCMSALGRTAHVDIIMALVHLTKACASTSRSGLKTEPMQSKVRTPAYLVRINLRAATCGASDVFFLSSQHFFCFLELLHLFFIASLIVDSTLVNFFVCLHHRDIFFRQLGLCRDL